MANTTTNGKQALKKTVKSKISPEVSSSNQEGATNSTTKPINSKELLNWEATVDMMLKQIHPSQRASIFELASRLYNAVGRAMIIVVFDGTVTVVPDPLNLQNFIPPGDIFIYYHWNESKACTSVSRALKSADYNIIILENGTAARVLQILNMFSHE